MLLDRPQRILLLVAHPDDESIGAGILLQRQCDVRIAFCTSGAPRALHIWLQYGYPGRCAGIREREALTALRLAGHTGSVFLRFRDGSLYKSIRKAYAAISDVVTRYRPELILTHAYENGHPDHDVCAFVAAALGNRFGITVWEMPYYRANPAGNGLIHQQFIHKTDDTVTIKGTAAELLVKRQMFKAHTTQQAILANFDPAREIFRPQPSYNFSLAPLPGTRVTAIHSLPLEKLFTAFRSLAVPSGNKAAGG